MLQETLHVCSNHEADAADDEGALLAAVALDGEDALPQAEMRFDSEEALAKCDEDGEVQD